MVRVIAFEWINVIESDKSRILYGPKLRLPSELRSVNQDKIELLLLPNELSQESDIRQLKNFTEYAEKAKARLRAVLLMTESSLKSPIKEGIEADPYWLLLKQRIKRHYSGARTELVDLVVHYHYALKSPMIRIPFFAMF